MSLRLMIRWSVLPLGAASLSVQAQQDLALDNIVVTAAGYEQTQTEAPASISVVTRESLEKRAYRDITDALQDVPGVVVTGGGDGEDVSLRGMPAQYTLWLVDGRRQTSRESQPSGGGGFQKDWLPPLSAIERIEVIRGPMSTLYGSDAIGGVINIITRKVAEDWVTQLRTEATIQEDSDSGNEFNNQLYVSGPLADDVLGLQLTGQYQHRLEDKIERGYAKREFSNLAARLSLEATPDHSLSLDVSRREQDRTSRAGFSLPERSSDAETENRHKTVALSHQGNWGLLTSDSYVQLEETDNVGRDIEIHNTVADSRWVLPLGDHFVTFGGTWEDEKLEDTTTNALAGTDEITVYQYALFLEDEWYLTDSFSLTAGLRMDDHEFFGEHYSPRLYGVWSLLPDWTLKGGMSTGFRAPNLRELSSDWVQESRGGDIYGNPDLDAEESRSYEMGLVHDGANGLQASLTLFYNDFDDKISTIACGDRDCGDAAAGDPDARTNVNIDDAITKGIEAGVQMPIGERWQAQASYTYTDSEQKSGDNEGQPLTQVPRHLFNTTVNWQATEALAPWLRFTFRGEESQPVNLSSNSSTSIRAPSYATWDAGLTWQATRQIRVLSGIYNLTDKDIEFDNFGHVDDGRRYWVGLDLEF
ncbi:TonB-dependent receptor [Halomonas sp. DP5N14-9]|uniref:TonB-dependent receptor domain-containing protein n=1 Tax=Halomonas sp. DP5N14-9 TaxID=2859075 RepID=UPI001C99DC75|nr:TonB-dependent receptor [Halomonas sp. DP5N14-9]MBY5940056.1 TonB-dependent receptor [Halomonas sp. DP5N14-9]